MTLPRFIQLHTLTTFPASLLNRDDAGLAKRLPFGGSSRIRISSQCLKRHWRTAEDEHAIGRLGEGLAVRSRSTFEHCVLPELLRDGLDEAIVRPVVAAVMSELLGESAKAKKEKDKGKEKPVKDEGPAALNTNQVIVLGRPELTFVTGLARDLCKQAKDAKSAAEAVKSYFKDKTHRENLAGMRQAAGLDGALFGRMVTSDILARVDAAVHVAHAFTVHAEEAETDYFSAVDDLLAEEQGLGSGHINETELAGGLFYGYVVVDVPQLVSNLQGCKSADWLAADRGLAADVVRNLIHLIATVSPGAKKGSTAPYSYASLVLAEQGTRQPRTLAGAFHDPVATGPGLPARAVAALSRQLAGFDRMYGRKEIRGFAAMGDLPHDFPADNRESLDPLADWVGQSIREAR